MCGICGIVTKDKGLELKNNIQRMSESMRSRGPDDSGEYFHDDGVLRIALGHRRLSIIDLAGGAQPIHNEDKTVWVSYNGEIYNFKEIREGLRGKGHKFYTRTDTEVIVHAYEEYGLDFVKQFNGMFAFALWDENKKQLFLVRDRMGIKPLYYYLDGRFMAFASDMRALIKIPQVSREIDHEGLDMYLTLRYVPGTRTVFKHIHSLPVAAIGIFAESELSFSHYWRPDFSIEQGFNEEKAIEKFFYLLEDSVKLRMISDVPLGAYLSGGLDSSTIVALMNRFSRQSIRTFCIGFGTDIDELAQARHISDILGTAHREFLVDKQSFSLFNQVVSFLDEPVGDAIIIPTYLLNKEASREVKVVLTGEGADEMLGGYIHHSALLLGNKIKSVFNSDIRKSLSALIRMIPVGMLNKFFNYPASLGYQGREKVSRFISSLDNDLQSYFSLAGVFNSGEKDLLYSEAFKNKLKKNSIEEEFSEFFSDNNYNFLNKVINLDMNFWLKDYTLLKQDRLSMANSVEARVPFLDHRLVEYCSHLALNLKIRKKTNKFILRRAAAKVLPKKAAMARKKAFYFPTEKCFSSGFSGFVRDILNADTVKKRGLFNFDYVKKLSADSASTEILNNKQLLSLLILEIWMREFLDKKD